MERSRRVAASVALDDESSRHRVLRFRMFRERKIQDVLSCHRRWAYRAERPPDAARHDGPQLTAHLAAPCRLHVADVSRADQQAREARRVVVVCRRVFP